MGKTVEESLPRTPQEAQGLPEAGWQVNRVAVLETGNGLHVETPPRNTPKPDDDASRW